MELIRAIVTSGFFWLVLAIWLLAIVLFKWIARQPMGLRDHAPFLLGTISAVSYIIMRNTANLAVIITATIGTAVPMVVLLLQSRSWFKPESKEERKK